MARKTSFYYSFLVLPAEQRQAIVAVWDFCRAVDDAVDESPPGNEVAGREAVRFWRTELARGYDGSAPSTPQGQRLQPFISRFDLPRQAFDDVTAHGCTIDDLAKGVVTDPVRRLLAFECARAREFYQRAVLARPDADRRRLVAAEIMRAVYFETLRRIERHGYDVFTARVRVRRPMQACIALKQWLWPA